MHDIECAERAQILDAGRMVSEKAKTIIYPTDTVYGLGANPRSKEGVSKCFQIKGRDASKPLPVLFSSLPEVGEFIHLSQSALILAKHFWPGKLTMVLNLKAGIRLPEGVAFDNTLAVRIPKHPCALQVIDACGGALIGTSANMSGQRPFTSWEELELQKLAFNSDFFVKGFCGENSEPSTIVDLSTDSPRIVRLGAIQKREILGYLSNTNSTAFS